jgi:P27 family predicted phage terminase small subunit
MAKAGRKPKPTALKLIQGNPGKRAINKQEPQPEKPVKVPSPPAELGKMAKAEWRRVAKELFDTGVLTRIDTKTLANYCQAYEDMKVARGLLAKHNLQNPDAINLVKTMSGMVRTHPLVQQIRDNRKDMMAFAAEFGLTPSSRSRVTTDKQRPKGEWDDF